MQSVIVALLMAANGGTSAVAPSELSPALQTWADCLTKRLESQAVQELTDVFRRCAKLEEAARIDFERDARSDADRRQKHLLFDAIKQDFGQQLLETGLARKSPVI